jgi:hypothetical protein
VGLYVRSGDWESASWAVERGLPIPGAGVIFWPRLLRLEVQGLLLGLTSGLMFWLIMIRAEPSTRAFHILVALFALATLTSIAALLR